MSGFLVRTGHGYRLSDTAGKSGGGRARKHAAGRRSGRDDAGKGVQVGDEEEKLGMEEDGGSVAASDRVQWSAELCEHADQAMLHLSEQLSDDGLGVEDSASATANTLQPGQQRMGPYRQAEMEELEEDDLEGFTATD